MTGEFSNALGWSADRHGSTVTFGDINGDARSDACGRGAVDIICAISFGELGPFAWRSNGTTAFDDGNNGWGDPAQYRSIRIADVNGDGYGDVCGRDNDGLRCAIARPISDEKMSYFLHPFRYTPRSFQAKVWQTEAHGTSLRFADLNRDGRADACWRSDKGLTCANN